MIGRTLSHFRILAKLGEGGMGVVYRAEDTDLRRPVALKVLPPEWVADEERRLRFLREARSAAAVTHPNIATVYEVGEAEGTVYIAMELVEGRTLREVIGAPSSGAGRPLPLKEALRVATEVAEGMARAHQARIVHRDLKPENLTIGNDQHVKILDFGLAKLLEEGGKEERGSASDLSKLETFSGEMTRAGRIFGTAAYMSPEQARGERVDERSDIFSFGSVLYEMVTGRPAFEGRTASDVMSSILRDEPRPASSISGEVSPLLDEVIGKCLEKDAADRYQRAEELVVDLRRLARGRDTAGQRVVAAPEIAGQHPSVRQGSSRRRIWIVGSVALAVLCATAILAVFVMGYGRRWLRGSGASGPIRSLAVLPLRNLSGDPTQEYFSDGMTEEVTATLARIQSLKIISSTSAMYYKGAKKPLREIARELDVDALLEGSVMRAGERVRVTAQLVEGATDRHLWAASYERDLRDVLALQAELARAIAQEVKAALTPAEKARLTEMPAVNPEVYEHYLRGRQLRAQLTVEGLTRAVEEFNRAIMADPGYAPAHAGLAHTYAHLSEMSVLPPREAYPRARASALRALELDPDLAEAQASLGYLKFYFERDWSAAEEAYRKAIELNPTDGIARIGYAFCLALQGKAEEALREGDAATQVDPLTPVVAFYRAFIEYASRHYPEALAQLRRLHKLHPDYGPAKDLIPLAQLEMGRYPEAIAGLSQRLESADSEVPFIMANLVRAYVLAGNEKEARSVLHKLQQESDRRYTPPSYMAFAHAALGERDQALRWLEKGLSEHDPVVASTKAFAMFDPLRADPRFAEFLRRAGFPEN